MEGLVTLCVGTQKSVQATIASKLSEPYTKVGDWNGYLNKQGLADQERPKADAVFDAFFDKVLRE